MDHNAVDHTGTRWQTIEKCSEYVLYWTALYILESVKNPEALGNLYKTLHGLAPTLTPCSMLHNACRRASCFGILSVFWRVKEIMLSPSFQTLRVSLRKYSGSVFHNGKNTVLGTDRSSENIDFPVPYRLRLHRAQILRHEYSRNTNPGTA